MEKRKPLNIPVKIGHGLHRARKTLKEKILSYKQVNTFKHQKKWLDDRIDE